MPTLLVLYPTPTDVATFDRRYADEHLPLVRQHLGMARFGASTVLGTPAGPAPYHLIADLEFDSAEAMQAAFASEGGQLTGAHAAEISTGGPPLMLIVQRRF
jgi:uncharacterized protein (TIGR02118 family)